MHSLVSLTYFFSFFVFANVSPTEDDDVDDAVHHWCVCGKCIVLAIIGSGYFMVQYIRGLSYQSYTMNGRVQYIKRAVMLSN